MVTLVISGHAANHLSTLLYCTKHRLLHRLSQVLALCLLGIAVSVSWLVLLVVVESALLIMSGVVGVSLLVSSAAVPVAVTVLVLVSVGCSVVLAVSIAYRVLADRDRFLPVEGREPRDAPARHRAADEKHVSRGAPLPRGMPEDANISHRPTAAPAS